jgi:hypothetical protein
MPVCFTLTRKADLAAGPVSFQQIDDEMCKHFGVEPDKVEYYQRWYDTVGLALACGHDWPKIKEIFPGKAEIIDWLAENFTQDAWSERK